VQAVRRKPDDRIAGPDAQRVRNRRDVDDPNDGSGQIEGVVTIDAGHLRRFAAQERGVVGAAGRLHAAHDLGRDRRIELADREVIEKEQRRRVHDQDVVDAVVDQVRADRAVAPQRRGDERLGTDAVGRRNQRACIVPG
jgi:hypothetical protein